MNIHHSTLAFLLILAAASAGAHDGLHGPAVKYDVDRDDQLSLDEYTAYREATDAEARAEAASVFATLDTDDDGYLSNAEFIRGL